MSRSHCAPQEPQDRCRGAQRWVSLEPRVGWGRRGQEQMGLGGGECGQNRPGGWGWGQEVQGVKLAWRV